jgi:predicted DNA-binding WGR domain protein
MRSFKKRGYPMLLDREGELTKNLPGAEGKATIVELEGLKITGVRHFEFVGGKSSKFWEISVDGTEVTVRFGRIGAAGTTKVKEFPDAEAAQSHADKLIGEKTGKGYVEETA